MGPAAICAFSKRATHSAVVSVASTASTRAFIQDMYASVKKGVAQGHDLRRVFADTDAALRPRYGQQFIYEHCMPFDVSRAYDEATAHRDPRIWTAERDKDMWASLQP
mgnify:CR=1 FL=1